jgi:hypothetical protein
MLLAVCGTLGANPPAPPVRDPDANPGGYRSYTESGPIKRTVSF